VHVVAPPADTDGQPARDFVGAVRQAVAEVRVEGSQRLYGGITRSIYVDDDELTIAQARELAAALTAAADECERDARTDEVTR
jgi:hypothetical protein